jgi:hypothetical protein
LEGGDHGAKSLNLLPPLTDSVWNIGVQGDIARKSNFPIAALSFFLIKFEGSLGTNRERGNFSCVGWQNSQVEAFQIACEKCYHNED